MDHVSPAQDHWQQVYQTKAPDSVSWHQPTAARSLTLLREGGLGPQSALIDVGGGASRLVDALLDEPVGSITVMDLSEAALCLARQRLGERAREVVPGHRRPVHAARCGRRWRRVRRRTSCGHRSETGLLVSAVACDLAGGNSDLACAAGGK